jgi:D-amino-acid dehydrogenase
MARTDVMVLGAGIVGASTALQLAKRGLSVVLVDRRGPGEETSYGNAGVIGGAGVYPMAFPNDLGELVRIALKRSPLANYHLNFLPKVVPWLIAFRAWSKPEKLVETARIMRPLLPRALGEQEIILPE